LSGSIGEKTPLDCLHCGEPGYNGDLLSSRTLVLTAEKIQELVARKTHTEKDTPVIRGSARLVHPADEETISSFFS